VDWSHLAEKVSYKTCYLRREEEREDGEGKVGSYWTTLRKIYGTGIFGGGSIRSHFLENCF